MRGIRLAAAAGQILTGTSAITAAKTVNSVATGFDSGNGTVFYGISCDGGSTCEVFDNAASIDKVTAPAGVSVHMFLSEPVPIKGPLKATVTAGAATVYYGR